MPSTDEKLVKNSQKDIGEHSCKKKGYTDVRYDRSRTSEASDRRGMHLPVKPAWRLAHLPPARTLLARPVLCCNRMRKLTFHYPPRFHFLWLLWNRAPRIQAQPLQVFASYPIDYNEEELVKELCLKAGLVCEVMYLRQRSFSMLWAYPGYQTYHRA